MEEDEAEFSRIILSEGVDQQPKRWPCNLEKIFLEEKKRCECDHSFQIRKEGR